MITRKSVPYSYQFRETMQQLDGDGLLLAATNAAGASNAMTIGWGTIGMVWGLPIFTVLVRPSRFTYQFIEESGAFTVNVPTLAMSDFVLFCGTKSGRDYDKFNKFKMGVTPAQTVDAVTIDACPLVYECRVVQKNDVDPAAFIPTVLSRFYAGGDYHRVYYGEIMGTYAHVTG